VHVARPSRTPTRTYASLHQIVFTFMVLELLRQDHLS